MRLCVLVTASCSSLVVLARVPGRERSLSLGRAEIACGPLLTWTEAVAGLMLPTPAGALYVICVCVVRVASDHIHTSLRPSDCVTTRTPALQARKRERWRQSVLYCRLQPVVGQWARRRPS